MQWLSELWRRLRFLIGRRRFEQDIEEEMRFHLAMKAQDHSSAGMAPEAARNKAQRDFGNATQVWENSREAWGWGALERFVQDLIFACRMLRKNRGATLAALLTLGSGIGASTVIYTVLHAVVLAPLPFPQPDRLIAVLGEKPRWVNRVSAPDIADMLAQSKAIEDVALAGARSGDVTGVGDPERVQGSEVSANLFTLLGVNAVIGRTLDAADAQPDAPFAILIGYGLWQRKFGGTAAALGQKLTVNGHSYTIAGVMPAWFHFPDVNTDYWVPLTPSPVLKMRANHRFDAVARLRPGASVEQANVEVNNIAARLQNAYPESNQGWSAAAVSLADRLVGKARPTLWILFGAVTMVLLVACANVANLLLLRGAQRRQEIAIRTALGASRWRLVRLLFTESLLLALLGGALGVAFASWGVRALVTLYPVELPRTAEIQLNWAVLGFALLLSLGAAMLAGLAPAARISQAALGHGLKSSARIAGLSSGRPRGAAVVVQIALAMVLLCCAGLLARSFALRTRFSGFDPSNVLTAFLSALPPQRIPPVLERIRAIPGVTAAAFTTSLSYEQVMGMQVEIEGRPAGGEAVSPLFQVITPDYFRVLNQPLYRGRVFAESDGADTPHVVIISERMSRQFFASGDALGHQLRFGPKGDWRTIVGVVADVPLYAAELQPAGAVYAPYSQFDQRLGTIVVRTAIPPQSVAGDVRAAIHAVEPSTPVIRLETMRADLSNRVASPRFYTVMLGLFAGVALALAGLGVYGVVSFAVSARTHEIGVRMALGAQSSDVLRATLREGAALAAVGAGLGLLCSLAAVRVLTGTNLLFRVKPTDPLTFACVPGVLFAAAMIASYAPARRAARVDPAIALRNE